MLLVALSLACTNVEPEIVGNVGSGETLYAANCVSCHGTDGRAGVSGSSDLNLLVPALEDADLEDLMLNGKGSMAAFPFDEQEMADLIAYLRATFG